MTTGSTVWGHDTGTSETNARDFSGNWTGTGTVSGSGDSEVINLGSNEYMESEIVNTGAVLIQLGQNLYNTGGDDVTIKYKTAATEGGIPAASWNPYSIPFTSLGYVQVRLESSDYLQPLSVSTTNARYFENALGNPVILVGFHTWGNVQNGDSSSPPAEFDWAEYLQALIDYGCNFTKLWCHETGRGWSDTDGYWFDPGRYERTGPGNDNDGKLKFDLTQINQDYLDRLRARTLACRNNGIYVCVQLFDGWSIESKGMGGNPFDYHPYEDSNNINSVDGDDDNDGEGTETHWPVAQGNNVLSYQEDLVEAIIDAVNDLDNVIYEITNEDTDDASGYNTDWQEYMIGFIQTYEAGKANQHLIGMTKQYPNGEDSTLDASGADWVSYSSGKADAVHSASDPPSMYDTDHTVGLTDEYSWLWEAFCNGHGGSWYMDEWDGAAYGVDRRATAAYILIRDNLGYLNTLVGQLNNLLLMTPQAALCSTGYCLARDHATAGEYVCYNVNGAASFTLNLTNATGTLYVRWLKCADGTLDTDDTVAGGAVRTLTNPAGFGVSVAYVRHVV